MGCCVMAESKLLGASDSLANLVRMQIDLLELDCPQTWFEQSLHQHQSTCDDVSSLLSYAQHNTEEYPIKYVTEEGQMFILVQIKLLLPTCNWTTMDNIQLSFDTSKCPHMNDHEGYMVCNLENFDQALRQSDLPEEFKNFQTMDRFSPFMGFCQKFKFQEGVHMCLVARKKELEKKKLENKFKSRPACLKACRSWPKK